MGNKEVKDKTLEIKNTQLSFQIVRKRNLDGQIIEDKPKFTLHNGVLEAIEEKIYLTYPQSDVKYYEADPVQKEISLVLSNSRKWTLLFEDLNEFLACKQSLSISMRPEKKSSSSCKNCNKSLLLRKSFYCNFCGEQFCGECSRFLTLLNFLGYSKEQRICEDCISPINRIKTCEAESFIKRADSESFMRSDSVISK